MYTVKCLNPIASKGLDLFTEDFKVIDDLDKADAVLVRSAAMHDLEVPESLLAVAKRRMQEISSEYLTRESSLSETLSAFQKMTLNMKESQRSHQNILQESSS